MRKPVERGSVRRPDHRTMNQNCRPCRDPGERTRPTRGEQHAEKWQDAHDQRQRHRVESKKLVRRCSLQCVFCSRRDGAAADHERPAIFRRAVRHGLGACACGDRGKRRDRDSWRDDLVDERFPALRAYASARRRTVLLDAGALRYCNTLARRGCLARDVLSARGVAQGVGLAARKSDRKTARPQIGRPLQRRLPWNTAFECVIAQSTGAGSVTAEKKPERSRCLRARIRSRKAAARSNSNFLAASRIWISSWAKTSPSFVSLVMSASAKSSTGTVT